MSGTGKAPSNRKFTHIVFSNASRQPVNYFQTVGVPAGVDGSGFQVNPLEQARALFPKSDDDMDHFINQVRSVTPATLATAHILNELMSNRVDRYTVDDILAVNFMAKDPSSPELEIAISNDIKRSAQGLRKIYTAKNQNDQIGLLPLLDWSAKLVFIATLIEDIRTKTDDCLNGRQGPEMVDTVRSMAQFISKASVVTSLDDNMMGDAVLYFNQLAVRADSPMRLNWSDDQSCVTVTIKSGGGSSRPHQNNFGS